MFICLVDLVWRYLQKGTAFHGAIIALDQLAYSRRMSPILKKKLKVVCLEEETGSNKMPINTDDWKRAVTETLTSDDAAEQTVEFDKAVEKVRAAHCGKRTKAHCEMKILRHFVSQLGPRDTHPISYIGVSKLACMGCWTVINAWNEKHDKPQFVVRGRHGKYYFPWAVPALASADDPIMHHICERVAETATQVLREKGIVRLKSDSSAPSGDYYSIMSKSQLKKNHEKVQARLEKYRANKRLHEEPS